jgi:hypothetical protein
MNDRTRFSAAVFSSTDGNVDLPYGQNSYSAFFAGSQAFGAGKLGVQRIGGYAMVGVAPTTYGSPTTGVPIPGSGTQGIRASAGLASRACSTSARNVDVQVVTQHGSDNAWFGACYGDLIDGPGREQQHSRHRSSGGFA